MVYFLSDRNRAFNYRGEPSGSAQTDFFQGCSVAASFVSPAPPSASRASAQGQSLQGGRTLSPETEADSGAEGNPETQHLLPGGGKQGHRGTVPPSGHRSLCGCKGRTGGLRPKVKSTCATGQVPGVRGCKEKLRGRVVIFLVFNGVLGVGFLLPH